MGEQAVISWFDDPVDLDPSATGEASNAYRFLSNFYQGAPIVSGPYTYRTGEHMFQAYKARSKSDHLMVVTQGSAAEAKQAGKHMLRLRPDWERVKYDVMRLVLASKFTLQRDEGQRLLDTGDALLIEGTYWNDQVWGVALPKILEGGVKPDPGEGWGYAPGRNWLGVLLMARRAELVAQIRHGMVFDYSTIAEFARTVPR